MIISKKYESSAFKACQKSQLKLFCLGIIMIFSFTTKLFSQPNSIYYLLNLPQSTEINPSFHNDTNRFWIGIPLLSGIQSELNFDGITWSDVILNKPKDYDSLLFNMEGFANAVEENNIAYEEFSWTLLNFGFKYKKMNFFFSVNERQLAKGTYNNTIINFLRDGNIPYIGETLNFELPWSEAQHFREYALGASKRLNKNLTVGGVVKFLFGKSGGNIRFSDFSLFTSEFTTEGSTVTIISNANAKFSAPVNVNIDGGIISNISEDFPSFSNYMLNSGNPGIAFGAGLTFKNKKGLVLSASIMDLGYINWKKDVHHISQAGEYNISDLDLRPLIQDGALVLDEITDSYLSLTSSVTDDFKNIEETEKFKTNIPAKLYLGARYNYNDNIYFGILSRTRFYGNKAEEHLTLSGNFKATNHISLSPSWSFTKRKYNNIGLGVLTEIGNFQFYAATDNLPGIIKPTKNSYIDLKFGLNLIFKEWKYKQTPSTCKSLSRSQKQKMRYSKRYFH